MKRAINPSWVPAASIARRRCATAASSLLMNQSRGPVASPLKQRMRADADRLVRLLDELMSVTTGARSSRETRFLTVGERLATLDAANIHDGTFEPPRRCVDRGLWGGTQIEATSRAEMLRDKGPQRYTYSRQRIGQIVR